MLLTIYEHLSFKIMKLVTENTNRHKDIKRIHKQIKTQYNYSPSVNITNFVFVCVRFSELLLGRIIIKNGQ